MLKKFEKIISKKRYVFEAAAKYGLAISYFENKEYTKAQAIIEQLLFRDKNNLFYADVLADISISTKNYHNAIDKLAELNLLMPNNQVVALNYANVLMEAEKFEQAELILQDFLLVQPNNFIANDLLTTVYRKQQKMALMHATKAEVLALLGAYSRAVDELQTGYTFAENKPLVKKRIKARILQFQNQEEKLKRLN